MRYKVLLNPEACEGKGRRILPDLKKLLYKENLEFETFEVEKQKDMIRFARDAAKEDYGCVVAVGGDGTVRTVVEGLRGTGLILGIIPAGTCNAFARTLKIPENYRQAIPILKREKIKEIDIGILSRQGKGGVVEDSQGEGPQIEEIPFLLSIAIGPRFMVCEPTGLMERERSKKIMKVLSTGVSELMNHPFHELNVSLSPPGSEEADPESEAKVEKFAATVVVIGNIRNWGPEFLFTPGANPDDGTFEVGMLTSRSKMDMAKFVYKHFTAAGTKDLPFFTVKKATSVKVNSMVPGISVFVDREEMGELPFAARIEPGALKVLVK